MECVGLCAMTLNCLLRLVGSRGIDAHIEAITARPPARLINQSLDLSCEFVIPLQGSVDCYAQDRLEVRVIRVICQVT